jgi:hypothetical protein
VHTSTNFRFLLAATVLLLLFTAAFEAAVWWPGQPPAAAIVELAAPNTAADAVTVPADTLPTEALAPHPEWRASKSAWRVVSSPALRRVLQVHRYVGTVGGQPATAELQWHNPDSISGRFYLHRAGVEYSWDCARRNKGARVFDFGDDGQWRLSGQPGGATLRAIWHKSGRRQVVAMRESYAGAVRYGMRRMLFVEISDTTAGPAYELEASIERDFLTLPAPATVRPSLRRLLNPGPKARLRQLTHVEESNSVASHRLTVRLNGFGLFSYQACDFSRQTGGTPDVGFESTLLDLATGRPITVESQLQRGYELPLQRLIMQHVLHGPEFDEQDRKRLVDDWGNTHLADYPDMDLGLTATGLEAVYWQPMYPASVLIPYRELRPLVRPGTQLARMLAARGM